MTEKTFYVAEDGVKFEDREECLNYEAEVEEVEEAIRIIHNYCAKHERFSDRCHVCPYARFCDNDFPPSSWKVKDFDFECILGSEFDDVTDEEDI